ncbi:MAG: efflux RND transporter periplasmic adaptor subunit, partial [Planctomycetes bacterium]|nr:efflux RND transporter periplasmic adaptor subunit [Planctomycetota bacterium]
EKAEAVVAEAEWQQLHPGTKPDSALVLRGPQIRQAEAQLESAKAKLAMAQLNLNRTILSLPVEVRIISKKVDLGQYITAGTTIGTAYGTDAVEIEVPLNDEDLAWFDIADGNVTAEVKAEFAGKSHIWPGIVKRTTGQVDTSSRLISVVIEVDEPFKQSGNLPPLLPGIFVEVSIKGNILKSAVPVPCNAIRNRNQVWVFDNGKLRIQTLNILRSDRECAYTTNSLRDGDKIIISSLNAVTEGMSVRAKVDESLSHE